jgi:hypothetical protein
MELRCFDQKRRFGEAFLFPLERYRRGLTELTVIDREGREVPNPLFTGGRTPELVRFGALVGMPWPLTATPQSLNDARVLKLLSADQLRAEGRWDEIVDNGQGRLDPHLLAAVEPRQGLPGPDSAHDADPIHGHDYANPQQAGLQYACTFALPEPLACTDPRACDCAPVDWEDGSRGPLSPSNPLCQAPDDSYGTTQYYAKAYPGERLLQLASEVDGVVASICPKTLDPQLTHSTAFGYTALFRSSELLSGVQGQVCLQQRWPAASTERQRCKLYEIAPHPADCELKGRSPVPDDVALALVPLGDSVDDYAFCEIAHAEGDETTRGTAAYACAHELALGADVWGYCYIDPERGVGSEALVSMCPMQAKRRIRFAPAGLDREIEQWQGIRYRLVCPGS